MIEDALITGNWLFTTTFCFEKRQCAILQQKPRDQSCTPSKGFIKNAGTLPSSKHQQTSQPLEARAKLGGLGFGQSPATEISPLWLKGEATDSNTGSGLRLRYCLTPVRFCMRNIRMTVGLLHLGTLPSPVTTSLSTNKVPFLCIL